MNFKLQAKESDKNLFSNYRYFYIKLLNKKGNLHLAENFFRYVYLNFKLNLSSVESLNLKDTFEYACKTAAPMFYLRKLTLGGLEYKVPWALFSKRRILNGSIFVLNTAKRKGMSKKDKIAKMLFEALYNQGDAIARRNEVYKIGRENRGLVYFIKK